MATYGEWKRIKPEDVGKTREERTKRAVALRGGDPAIARMNLPYSEPPATRDPALTVASPPTAAVERGKEIYSGLIGMKDNWNKMQDEQRSIVQAKRDAAPQRNIESGASAEDFAAGGTLGRMLKPDQGVRLQQDSPIAAPIREVASRLAPRLAGSSEEVTLAPPETPLPVSNPPQMSQVARLPLEGGAEATKITRPDGATRWATKNGYMDAATPKATSTNNALGITDEAFSPGGSFSVASGPRGGMSQAEWDGLSQEEATAIRVAGLEKQGQALQGLQNVRDARAYQTEGGPLTRGAAMAFNEMSGGAPSPGMENGTAAWRAANPNSAVSRNYGPSGGSSGSSFAGDFDFANKGPMGDAIEQIQEDLESKNPKTRRAAMAAMTSIYKQQAGAQPQTVGPDFGDQLAQAQMQQNAAFKQADLAGKQQDRMLNQEQKALENRRADTEADQAEVKVLTAQLDKVMGSGQVVPGTEGILNAVMLQKRANPLMVNSIIQEALTSLPESKKALANPNTDPKAVKDKQAALAAIREYVAQKMP